MKQPVSIQDLFGITLVSNPKASPDGSSFAWVQTTVDEGTDTYRSAIWISVNGESRQLTAGTYRDGSPAWSPDGSRIAFVSNRPIPQPKPGPESDKKPSKPQNQVWVVPIAGGEARLLTSAENGAGSPAWSPDGSQIVFAASDAPTDDEINQVPTCLDQIADERLIRHVHYRGDGKGYIEKFSHLWLVAADTGVTRQLTFGPFQDSQPTFSPDGTRVAFAGNRREDAAAAWDRSAIHVVDVETGAITLVSSDDGRFSTPSWSPDGTRIAYCGYEGTSSASLDAIWTAAADGAEAVNHTSESDLGCSDSGMSDVSGSGESSLEWNGKESIRFLASANGETQVWELTLSGGALAQLTSGQHRIAGFASVGDDLVAVRSTINRPFELERWREGTIFEAVTAANADFLDNVALMSAEDLSFTAPDGTEIQGWLIPPHGFDPNASTRHPLIIQIHGGPHAMYSHALFHEMQAMAARGYAVAFCNPRGSAGYGHEFQSCTRGVWGTADMPDVIALVDTVSTRHWIDTDRIGITGGSYGGYLTNWIVAHDQRFKAAVTQRCVSSFLSFFGTSDIGTTFGVSEFDGLPWSDTEKLFKQSPIAYVDRIQTPLLILHSEQDLRCPIEQAEQMFASLKYLGRETLFIRFPEEGHELSRSGTPSRRIARLTHLIGWFDTHLQA